MATGAFAGTASAETARISQGDAETALRSFTTGGWAVRLHSKQDFPFAFGDGTGPAVVSSAVIRPLPFGPWNGGHFCTLDWHTLALAFVEGGDKTFSKPDAAKLLDMQQISLFLDGNLLETTRTPIQRFLAPERFGWDVGYGFQTGRVVAPGELTVGSHEFSAFLFTTGENNGGEITITIHIDAAGTGACG